MKNAMLQIYIYKLMKMLDIFSKYRSLCKSYQNTKFIKRVSNILHQKYILICINYNYFIEGGLFANFAQPCIIVHIHSLSVIKLYWLLLEYFCPIIAATNVFLYHSNWRPCFCRLYARPLAAGFSIISLCSLLSFAKF